MTSRSNPIESFLLGVACMGLAIVTVISASHFVVPIITIEAYSPITTSPPLPVIQQHPTTEDSIGVQMCGTPPPEYTVNSFVVSFPTYVAPSTTPTPIVYSSPIPTATQKVTSELIAQTDNVALPTKVIYNGNIRATIEPTPTITHPPAQTIYETYPELKSFSYINDYSTNRFSMVMYGGVNDYFNTKDRKIYVETTGESYRKFLRDEVQDTYMADLMGYIRSKSTSVDEQAIHAIRFVQNIPYDEDRVEHQYEVRYPYQVVYDNEGVCSEKSILLIYILSKLGYNTVYVQFEDENHAVVGVKCDDRYEYKGTGYCFVETTLPVMITYSGMEYGYVGKLKSSPNIIHMSDGKSLKLIENEWRDANKYGDLTEKALSAGGILPRDDYNEWFDIVKRYGMQIG